MWSDDPFVGPTPFHVQVVEFRDAEDEPDFRGVQFIIGEDTFNFFADDESALGDLLNLVFELYCWSLSAEASSDREELDGLLQTQHLYDPDLDLGFYVDDFVDGFVTLTFFTGSTSPRRLATVTFGCVELSGVASLVGEMLHREYSLIEDPDYFHTFDDDWFSDPLPFEITTPSARTS